VAVQAENQMVMHQVVEVLAVTELHQVLQLRLEQQ
jgi:hypothetical protein